MPRFVILRHELPTDHERASHWDLMLESGSVLLTWALEAPLCFDESVAADALPDHRLAYLDYEGPVSAGRGQVTRCDHGEFEWVTRQPGQMVADLWGAQGGMRIRITLDSSTQRWSVESSSIDSAKRG